MTHIPQKSANAEILRPNKGRGVVAKGGLVAWNTTYYYCAQRYLRSPAQSPFSVLLLLLLLLLRNFRSYGVDNHRGNSCLYPSGYFLWWFQGSEKTRKKNMHLVHFWEARRRQGWPRFWALFWTLFWDFLKKSAFTIPSQNGSFLPDLVILVISAFTIPSQNDSFLPDLVILPGRPTLRCAPPALQVSASREVRWCHRQYC